MARAAAKRRPPARRHDTGRKHKDSGGQRYEDTLFFNRLRTHAKWVFVLLIIVFGGGFIFLGVGSGGLDLNQLLDGIRGGGGSPGDRQTAEGDREEPEGRPGLEGPGDRVRREGRLRVGAACVAAVHAAAPEGRGRPDPLHAGPHAAAPDPGSRGAEPPARGAAVPALDLRTAGDLPARPRARQPLRPDRPDGRHVRNHRVSERARRAPADLDAAGLRLQETGQAAAGRAQRPAPARDRRPRPPATLPPRSPPTSSSSSSRPTTRRCRRRRPASRRSRSSWPARPRRRRVRLLAQRERPLFSRTASSRGRRELRFQPGSDAPPRPPLGRARVGSAPHRRLRDRRPADGRRRQGTGQAAVRREVRLLPHARRRRHAGKDRPEPRRRVLRVSRSRVSPSRPSAASSTTRSSSRSRTRPGSTSARTASRPR